MFAWTSVGMTIYMAIMKQFFLQCPYFRTACLIFVMHYNWDFL